MSQLAEFESMIDAIKMDIANPEAMQPDGVSELNLFDNMIGLNTQTLISDGKCKKMKKQIIKIFKKPIKQGKVKTNEDAK